MEELKRWGTGGTTHPEDLPRVVELFTDSIASGEPFEFEVRARRFDGVYRWFQSRGFPLRDTNGHIVRWYNLLIDIDERKRAEEALRESERESRLIVDTIPGLVALLTPGGEVEVVNRQLVEYCGQTLEEMRQWGTNGTVHPEDLPHVIEVFTHSIASGESIRNRGSASGVRMASIVGFRNVRLSASRYERAHRSLVRAADGHRRAEARRGRHSARANAISN